MRSLALLMLLSVACSATDTDDDILAVDADGDGFVEADDCDDNDASIHPGATELCNDVDDNCDGVEDEGFDNDNDGWRSAEACAEGSDCDDNNPDRNPDTTEIPYDGIDQNCSGADIVDVDGDGANAIEAGGDDCDDKDAKVGPDQAEIPKNGVDDDCVGGDLLDEDGDGYDDIDFGGDDCDDTDPEVHPGVAIDWAADEVDADCDGKDGAPIALSSAPITIDPMMRDMQALGAASALCDVDADGMQDIVLANMFSNGLKGGVVVFRGADHAKWARGMDVSAASGTFVGDGLIGEDVVCGDVDGDGYDDVVAVRGENKDNGTSFGVSIVYGGSGSWRGSLGPADAVTFTRHIGWPEEASNVASAYLALHDMDRDGAHEVLYLHGAYWDASSSASLWVLPGIRHIVGGDWIDSAGTPWTTDETGNSFAWVTWEGTSGDHFSNRTTAADLDGDGDRELIIAAPRADRGSVRQAGLITVYRSPAELRKGVSHDPVGSADAVFRGTAKDQWLGWDVVAAGDVDDDGCEDLLVWDPQTDPRTSRPGPVRLVSGCRLELTGKLEDIEASTAMSWLPEQPFTSWAGGDMHAGDIDGDGRPDLVFGDQGVFHTPQIAGRVYVYLSSTMEW